MAFAKGGEGEKISKCVAHNRYVGWCLWVYGYASLLFFWVNQF